MSIEIHSGVAPNQSPPQIAHQKLIRDERRINAGKEGLFGAWWDDVDTDLGKAEIMEIKSETAKGVILEYEWLGTMPQAVQRCFGLYWDGNIAGALVFAEKPGSNLVSDKSSIVPSDCLYLARGACVHWAHPHSASWFISNVARSFLGDCTILAYSDPSAGEIGTIYQALNWVYLGPSKGGPTAFLVDGKLITSRSFQRDRGGNGKCGKGLKDVKEAFPSSEVVPVPRKGRYVGIYGKPSYRKEMRKRISPHGLDYPKRESVAGG
jgi:hypothetical protein